MKKPMLHWFFLGLIILSCYSCTRKMQNVVRELSKPKPISSENIPGIYFVVVFNEKGEPLLLKSYFEKNEWPLFCTPGEFKDVIEKRFTVEPEGSKRSGSSQSFYIEKAKIPILNDYLTQRFNNKLRSVIIKVLEDNPTAKSQLVYIDIRYDDYNFYSIYRVDKKGVIPEQFGESTRNHGVLGLRAGLKYFRVIFSSGIVLLLFVRFLISRRKLIAT